MTPTDTATAGDCNETIDEVLRELAPLRWGTDVCVPRPASRRDPLEHRREAREVPSEQQRVEGQLWILLSPTMIAREARRSEEFRQRVSNLNGSDRWLGILHTLDARKITAEEYRQEMVNLMRFQLETTLGYEYTHQIPMTMSTNKITSSTWSSRP